MEIDPAGDRRQEFGKSIGESFFGLAVRRSIGMRVASPLSPI